MEEAAKRSGSAEQQLPDFGTFVDMVLEGRDGGTLFTERYWDLCWACDLRYTEVGNGTIFPIKQYMNLESQSPFHRYYQFSTSD